MLCLLQRLMVNLKFELFRSVANCRITPAWLRCRCMEEALKMLFPGRIDDEENVFVPEER